MAERAPLVAALVAAVVIVGAVPALALAAVGPSGSAADAAQGTNGTAANESLAPGERLSGVVGVQQAELDGEVTARAFERQVAAAGSNASAARLVGATAENISERIAALEAEKADLERAFENGTLTRGQYQSQLATLHVEKRALERLANRTGDVARGLPAETLEANGVNVSAIERLRSDARNLTGPEVAAVARSIAGNSAGNGVGPPDRAGPPGFVENRTGGPDGGPGGPPNGTGPGGDGGPPDDAGPSDDDDSGTPDNDDSGTPDNDDSGTPDNADSGTPDDDDAEASDDAADADETRDPVTVRAVR